MHKLEPYYNWRKYYDPDHDVNSPFSELIPQDGNNNIYNYVLHSQWERFGSPTLYLKILFADYNSGSVIIEFIGEWNDCINNDVMYLKRDVVEPLMQSGIKEFILIGENILNFHADGDDYFEEWFEEVTEEGGWIAAVNFNEHVTEEMQSAGLTRYLQFNQHNIPWRTFTPAQLSSLVSQSINNRITSGI
jgi:hypothetical protein